MTSKSTRLGHSAAWTLGWLWLMQNMPWPVYGMVSGLQRRGTTMYTTFCVQNTVYIPQYTKYGELYILCVPHSFLVFWKHLFRGHFSNWRMEFEREWHFDFCLCGMHHKMHGICIYKKVDLKHLIMQGFPPSSPYVHCTCVPFLLSFPIHFFRPSSSASQRPRPLFHSHRLSSCHHFKMSMTGWDFKLEKFLGGAVIPIRSPHNS